jgi:FkbM family methyltransferase
MNLYGTRHGLMLLRSGTDLISNTLINTGSYEYEVVDLCATLAQGYESGYIVDIGANMGTVTVPLAKRFPWYKVRSYEPQRRVFYQLAGNVFVNDLDNVEIFQHGLGASAGMIHIDMPNYGTDANIGAWSMDDQVRLNSFEGKGGGAVETVRIEVLNDQVFDQPIRVIKIDVEGMELEVLTGADKLLAVHEYPPLVYECWQQYEWHMAKAQRLDNLVQSMGYETHHIRNTTFAIHRDREIEVTWHGGAMRIDRKKDL